jgi:leucyl-tRNA synthetase
MQRYNPSDIEPKWQKIWDETGVYTANLKSNRPKYIAMSMFNYPSGAGIHIGHAMNYTISDVKARFKRQQGYESYHPVGWDAFGLPAENYAIKTGVSPQESMANIIPGYHKQYKAMGWSNDWQKEIATHLPEYYKWTQWIFSEMYRRGLAYQDSRMQWWCSIDKTVLANEQVIDGKCWRHDGPNDPLVEKREVKQWFFKITDYADELLAAIDQLDWSESVKLAQKNWIGKSVGAEIEFRIHNSKDTIKVFTTRADTIFSAALIILAPEHKLTKKITTIDNQQLINKYIEDSEHKSEVERQADKDKSGVFTGAYAINPANGEKIPIWISDFVLAGYGTGAIFGDIHDERDFEFIKKINIPARVSIIPEDEQEAQKVKNQEYCYSSEGILIDSAEFSGLRSNQAREKIIDWLAKKKVAKEVTNYRMLDWSVSRQRYWGAPIPVINCPKCGSVLVPDKDLPVILPELTDYQPTGDGRSALARAKDWLSIECPQCHGLAERETDTLDTYIDSSWYMYRYFDPQNQNNIFDSEIVKKWEPIDFYNGADHATAHLLYARFIARFFTKIGLINEPEPFKQFLFNGKVTASDGQMFSKSKGNGVDPLEIISSGYGADSLRIYLMFAAPLDLWVKWDSRGVPGAYRFLNRLWNLVSEYLESADGQLNDDDRLAINQIIHPMIKKVTEDIENNRYNTAIATIMGSLNELYRIKKNNLVKCDVWLAALSSIIACVAPFAPHISEELWQLLGNSTTVHRDTWPKWDEQYLVSEEVTIVIQVNGKVRAEIKMPQGANQEDVLTVAQKEDNIKRYLAESSIKKVIYIADKILNIVVG